MKYRPNVLCIVPPYAYTTPPLGAASLLGYLKSKDCDEFDFIDLRLWTSISYAPTFRPMGTFGESFVIDVPDLPLVLKCLDTFDRRADFSLQATDSVVERYALDRGISPTYLCRYLERLDAFLEHAMAQLPDVEFIGFSVWASNLLATLMAAAHLKRRNRPPFVVLGGPQVTESRNSAALALHAGLADVVVRGEGEVTLLAVYQEFRRTGRAESIPGTIQLDREGKVAESARPLMRITEKPLPDFSTMPILAYQQHSYRGMKILPFELSRGCTDKCTFCSEWVFWQKYRPDSPDRSVEQIAELKQLYGINAIQFADSLLNGVPGRIRKFAEGMLQKKLELKWCGFFRANMDDETAVVLKNAGLFAAFIGVESFSDETLVDMNKRMDSESSIRSVVAFLRAGLLKVTVGYIPGFPGDTRARFLNTARILRHLQAKYPGPLVVNAEPFVVSPGQTLYADLASVGLVGEKWSDEILDLAPAYREVTENILCSVSGSNQGIERLGQLRIAALLAADADRSYTLDVGMYAYSENLRDRHFVYRHIQGDWWLARYVAPSGNVNAFVVSGREKYSDGSAASNTAIAEKWRQSHVVCPSLDVTLPGNVSHVTELPKRGWLMLSPFCVCRDIDTPDMSLLLIDHHTGAFMRTHRSLTPMVKQLAAGPFSLSALTGASMLPPDVTSEQLTMFLEKWLRLGLLVVVPDPPELGARLPPVPVLAEDPGLVRLSTTKPSVR